MSKTLIIIIVTVAIIIGGYFVWGYLYPAGISYAPLSGERGVVTPPSGYTQNPPAPQLGTSALPSVSAKTWQVDCKDDAYVPKIVDIKKGDTVTWTNVNCDTTWPASAMHPTHGVYPQKTGSCAAIGGSDFDSCGGLKTGESWSFRFDFAGSWKYHDHLRPSLNGTVSVSE